MKKYVLVALVMIVFFKASNGQKHSCQLEIMPFIRYDAYPEFLDISLPLEDNYVTSKGTSYGLNVSVKKAISQKYKLILGVGYYRNTFNNIENRNTRFGVSDRRKIKIITPSFLPLFTDRYWYHSIAVNIGIQRDFVLKNNYVLSVDALLNNFFTFSQYYHLTNNPGGSLDYKKSEFKYSGLSTILEIGLQKTINRFSVDLKLLIPVYTNGKKDDNLFDESSTGSRGKWLKGIGFGISFNYSLNTKSKS